MLVEDPATSFEDLGVPGESEDTPWESLDDKIRSAVSKLYEGKLGKFLLRKSEEMRRGGMTLIRGRQILRLICQWFQTNNSMRQVYGLKELSMVELQGDDLETFWSDWVRVLSGQRSPDTITPEQKEELFYKQLKKSERMRADIAHYRRQAEGHADRTYEYLKLSLECHIRETREDKNQEALESSVKGNGNRNKEPILPVTERLCPFHQKGHCRDGDRCKMKHADPVKNPKGDGKGGKGGKGDGKNPKAKSKAGAPGSGGKASGAPPASSGNTTPRKVDKSKFPCYGFIAGTCKGNCKFGYSHRQLTDSEKPGYEKYLASRATSPAPTQTTEAEVCPMWRKGDCPLGRKCRNKHPKAQKGADKDKD